jgi:formiminoglutamate deiminase
MSALWCERAWLGGNKLTADVLIAIEDGSIASVRAGSPAPADAQRLHGVVLPGFANAHSHAFQRALRGRTHGSAGSFWTWRKQMYALAASLEPDSMLAVARATFGEMALAGITLVGEFHYVHHNVSGTPYEDPNAMGLAVIEAARQAGVRLTLLDACYLHGGLEPDPVQKRFFDRDVEAWCSRTEPLADSPHVRVGAAIHSMRAVQPEPAAIVARWAAQREMPLHAHVSEQVAENEACIEVYGATPVGLLHFAGALNDRFTAVHATHLRDEDAQLLGAARACVCMCPTTERDLADGIGPATGLQETGVQLALGSDAHAMIEPLEEARAVELDERLGSGIRGRLRGYQLLEAATRNGYASLGWASGGVIARGAPADLVALRTDSVRLAGTPDDALLDALVFAGAAADVTDVIVAGEVIVRDSKHVSIDVARELSAAVGRL